MSRRAVWIWCSIGILLAVAARGAKGDRLEFGRVYVPADQIDQWPRGSTRYLPVDAAEFERLLSTARAAAGNRPRAGAIASAEYRARLDGSVLIDGKAKLEVVLPGGRPTFVSLEPCSVAIKKASWDGTEEKPAVWGVDAEGGLRAWAVQAGQLLLDWSVTGARDPGGTVAFELDLPECAATRLVLQLPSDRILQCDEGIVVRKSRAEGGMTPWRVELGGRHHVRFRVVATGGSAGQPEVNLAQQALVYDLSERGMELSAELKLDVSRGSLRELSLTLDPGLQLVSARSGEQFLNWSAATEARSGTTRVELRLPESMGGTSRMIRLGALGKVVMDRPWRLPGIRVDGVFWQEGNTTLLVSAPLLIAQVTPLLARQSKMGALPAPSSGESLEFQYFQANSGLEIVLSHPGKPLQVDCGTAVELRGGEITAKTIAEFRVAEGERFMVEAALAGWWSLDSVESIPANVLDDWTREKAKEEPGSDTAEPPGQKLVVRLARAITPSQPLRLVMTSRSVQSPLGRELTAADLMPLRFPAGTEGRRLTAVRAAAPYWFQLSGAEQLKRLDVKSLDSNQLALFAEPPRDVVFENDAGAQRLRIALKAQRPRYSAAVQVEASAGEQWLVESYRLRCVPEAAQVERVLVHLSGKRQGTLQWSIVGEAAAGFNVRPLSPAEQKAAEAPTEGETWEVAMQRPRGAPFEIRATRSVPLAGTLAVSLVCLPEATSQQGTLVIRQSPGGRVRFENRRLRPIPATPTPPEQYHTDRATYRYDPAREMAAGVEAAVVLHSEGEGDGPPPAWIWSCQADSLYSADGAGQHLVTYRLQNSGRRRLELAMPPETSEVHAVWVGLAKTTWKTRDAQGSKRLSIELPSGEKFPVVAVHFLTVGRRPGIAATIRPPLPEADLPTLARLETVWLPPGYEASEPDLRWEPRRRAGLTWMQRLFGPLGRAGDSSPFNPLAMEDWFTLGGFEPRRLGAEHQASQLLERIGQLVREEDEAETSNDLAWGVLLGQGTLRGLGALSSPDERVFVDETALARAGIWPWTRVAERRSARPRARGAGVLQEAGVAILIHPHGLLITSAMEVALHRDNLRPAEGRVLWDVLPGPLADRIARAREEDSGLATVESWVRNPAERRFPWPTARVAGSQPINMFGWSAARLESPRIVPSCVSVVHRAGMKLLGWIVFLAVIAFGWWRLKGNALGLVIAAGVCGVLALLVPTAYQPIASGALLGFLFCLLLPLVWRPRTGESATARASRSSDTSFRISEAAQIGALILAIVATLALGGIALGDDAPPSSAGDGGRVHRVLIPVDQQQEPIGGKYYVSEPLYTELYRRASSVEEPQGWLIRSATYWGVLAWQAAPERMAPVELKASLELQVFGGAGPIRIPLGHEGVELSPQGATLDGRAVAAQWTPDGKCIALERPEPGNYRLEVGLRPTPKKAGNGTGFDVKIPRLANSRLELSLPRNAPAIEVSSALGVLRRSDGSSRLTAELGPTDRLRVLWQEESVSGVGPTLDVDELLWLKVQPGSVVIEAQFCVKVVKGRIHQIRLVADPRLQVLPPQRNDSTVKEIYASLGQPQSVRLELAKPVEDQVTVKLSFLLRDSVGVGSLKLPQLEMADAQVTKRWLALSVDPALHCEEHPEKAKPLAVPDFAGAWGECETQPDSACDLSVAPVSAWSISTRPRRPHTTAYQQMTLNYGAANVLVQLDAEMVTSPGYRFQYQLAIPRELEVNRVSVLAEDVERVVRWSRSSDGSLIVFLTGPVAGRHSLSLRGTMPVSVPGKASLPTLRIEDCEVGSSAVILMRQPSVLLGVEKVVGMEEAEPARLDREAAGLARVAKSYVIAGGKPAACDVVLTANRADIQVEHVTALRPRGASWEAVEDVEVVVKQGVLDELSLEAPSRFAGPYRIEPPATLKVLETPGGPRRLVIRPRAEVRDHLHIRITGPLSSGPGEPLSVPRIVVEQAEAAKQFVVLPSKRESQTVRWETQGLKATAMPKHWAAPLPAASAPIVYEVTAKDYRAVLESPDRQSAAARINLADIQVAWQADGSCYGTASFHLDPAGLAMCPLDLPAGLRLVQAMVAGVPVTPMVEKSSASASSTKGRGLAARPRQYALPLCSKTLPQRIELVFAGELSARPMGNRVRFDAPRLGSIPVDQALWTIGGPPLYQPRSAPGAARTSPSKQELLRLSSAIQLVEPVSTTTTEEPDALLHWYEDWSGHLDASRSRLRRLLALAGAEKLTSAAANQLSELEAKQGRIASLLGAERIAEGDSVVAPLTTAPIELWESTLVRPEAAARYLSAGADCLVVDYARVRAGRIGGRLFGAAVVGGLLVVVVMGVRRGIVPGPLARWPYLCGAVVGLAWWLWLTPSILGLLIVAASALSSLRPGWRPYQASDSAIVPLRLSK